MISVISSQLQLTRNDDRPIDLISAALNFVHQLGLGDILAVVHGLLVGLTFKITFQVVGVFCQYFSLKNSCMSVNFHTDTTGEVQLFGWLSTNSLFISLE